ncbi:biotin synthase BioB [candidate division FCPU426 bacterium]|nr:biotin synthase BioB [candidate division FCPU426 bacterium]
METRVRTGIHPDIMEAYCVLEGKPLSRTLAQRLVLVDSGQLLDLVSLANKVRNKFSPAAYTCTIFNAKSGVCSEDCRFCAQSSHHAAPIEVYPLVSESAILAAAEKASSNQVRSFGIVTSGFGYDRITREFRSITRAIHLIHDRYPELAVCASLGVLSPETAGALAKAGISHYNINLQVNPARYAKLISTTHTVEARIETIALLQECGIKTCVGGIIGVGENMSDRVELAYVLKDLDVDVIPINVLIPIANTALASQPPIPAAEVAKTFALFRLIHPGKVIKFAAGRETLMKDFQGLLMLAGANGFLTGGYLTTRGREAAEDQAFLTALSGF